jgi:hypothetical protein
MMTSRNEYISLRGYRPCFVGTSIADDLEVLLIQKLRDICGADFVSKLQKMLKDKLLSKVRCW